jgi:hypothetical protein
MCGYEAAADLLPLATSLATWGLLLDPISDADALVRLVFRDAFHFLFSFSCILLVVAQVWIVV